jgi:plastocyanin
MKRTTNLFIAIVLLVPMLVSCGTGGGYAAATSQPATQTPNPPANMPTDTPLPPAPPAAGAVDVKIQGFAFDPPTLTVKAGTKVTWTNNDSAGHTVVSDAGDWASGDLATGATFSHTFDTPGTFTYHCGVHPAMKGKIIVQ